MRSATTPPKGLTVVLWVLQVVLAAFFVLVGYSHAILPYAEIAEQAVWMKEVPRSVSLFIGWAEIVGGVGVILPSITRIAPWLAPVAALGLATIMVLAALFHLMKGEGSVIGLHVVVTALALVVAWGRWRKAPIAGR